LQKLETKQQRDNTDAVIALPDLAKAGDSVALRLVMERLVSPVRERPVSIAGMPKINVASDLIAAASAVAEDGSRWRDHPRRSCVAQLVANTAKAVETFELAERLARLEEKISPRGSAP
jgi:hypothetical protein